jgi:hypothetical protein
VQLWLIFTSLVSLLYASACFGLIGHHQVYKLLWWRNLLLCCNVVLFFFFVTSSDSSRLHGLSCCSHARVWFMVLLFFFWLSVCYHEWFHGRQPAATVRSYENIQNSHTLNQRKISKPRKLYAEHDHDNPYNLEEPKIFTTKKNRRTLHQTSIFLHHNNLYTWRWPVRPKHVVIYNKGRRVVNINQSCT